MNPQRKIELLGDVTVIQAMAIETLSEWLQGEGGDEWSEAWMEAIYQASLKFHQMTVAQCQEYSRRRRGMYEEWVRTRATQTALKPWEQN